MIKKKAILIAANLKGTFAPEYKDVGNVLAHASHIEKVGAVLWDFFKSGQGERGPFLHPDIRRGYFYSVADQAVTHVFDVEYIKAWSELPDKRAFHKYLIDCRKCSWNQYRDETYWVKITGIFRLKNEHPLHDFKKYSDQKPLMICRNYAIVVDPHFKHHNTKITRREIMSDYIGELLSVGKVSEKDIEELFSYRLADKLTLVERQGSFRKGAGRLDLLYINRQKHYFLYELKKGIAKLPALEQIRRYMKATMRKHKIQPVNLRGIILAKSIDPILSQALKGESNIESKTYSFAIELK